MIAHTCGPTRTGVAACPACRAQAGLEGARVEHDQTGAHGTVKATDANYRALVAFDTATEPLWVPRRRLIILAPEAGP